MSIKQSLYLPGTKSEAGNLPPLQRRYLRRFMLLYNLPPAGSQAEQGAGRELGAMGKAKSARSNGGVLRTAAKALQRRRIPLSPRAPVPDDVKEGQFAVVAVWNDEATRFVASLSCLSNPLFLRLLKRAEEEFGFEHEGAIAVPCRPAELERIISDIAA